MNIHAYKTNILQPPQDDFLQAIKDSDISLREKDVVVVASKAVAIHEGRCIKVGERDKEELIKEEAEVYVTDADNRWPVTLKHGTFLASAGIDESNANEHFILLPQDPHRSAKELHEFLRREYGVEHLGVIVTDSHSMPLRYGTLGVSLGWCGFEPVTYFTGKPDLFGRTSRFTRINVVDSLAVAGVFAMGETSEQTPICVIQNAPHVRYTHRDTSRELLIPPREDIYWPFLKSLYEHDI